MEIWVFEADCNARSRRSREFMKGAASIDDPQAAPGDYPLEQTRK